MVLPLSLKFFPMAEPIQIRTAERDGEDGLIVTFSDGTITGYVAEELLELRPFREPTEGTRPVAGMALGPVRHSSSLPPVSPRRLPTKNSFGSP